MLSILGTVILAGGLVTMTGYSANASPRTSPRSTIPGSSPAWVSDAHAIGSPAGNERISFRVALQLRDAASAEALAAAVSDPKSRSYGKYLTSAQFNARFGPTDAQVEAVSKFLTSQGVSVSKTGLGNRWIDATGTVAQVQAAFATTMKTYNYHGKRLRGTPANLSAPSNVAGLIAGVIGVSEPASIPTPKHVAPRGAITAVGVDPDGNAAPNDALPPPALCSTYYGQHTQTVPVAYGRTSFPTYICGYSPAQIRGAYGIASAVAHHQNGAGITVAIIDAYGSSTIVADADALSAQNGEPAFQTGQYRQTLFTPFTLQDECGGEDNWNEEQTLDVEAVHAMAPGAAIHYVGAADCDTGIDDAMNYVIQNHLADIVSNSYGFVGEDGLGNEVAVEHSLFLQAALEGIGLYFSSGDSGDETINGAPHPEPDYPASDPLVTAVGGTAMGIDSRGRNLFETAWGNMIDVVDTSTSPSTWTYPLPGYFWAGGGGGTSALFSQPGYQRLAVPRSLATRNGTAPMRVVPDVAALADPYTGFGIVFRGELEGIGGTSLAAPLFAGIQALASQHRRHPIGFANPLLYLLGLGRIPFHDVTAASPTLAFATPSGRVLVGIGQDTSLIATRRYDDATGLGTPNGLWLLLGEALL